jgi:hypothetical protein
MHLSRPAHWVKDPNNDNQFIPAGLLDKFGKESYYWSNIVSDKFADFEDAMQNADHYGTWTLFFALGLFRLRATNTWGVIIHILTYDSCAGRLVLASS